MQYLKKEELSKVVGGNMTCEVALVNAIIDWNVEPFDYCTQVQATTYVVAMVDMIYNTDFINQPWKVQDQMEAELILGLNL